MKKRPSFLTATLVSITILAFVAGYFIPEFYDWTGADQSRPSKWMWIVPLAVSVGGIVFSISLRWLPVPKTWDDGRLISQQYNLRFLLIVTAIVAVASAVGSRQPAVGASLLFWIAVAFVLYRAFRCRKIRLPIAVMFAAMYLPFVWLFEGETRSGFTPELLWLSNGLPSLLPAALVIAPLALGRDSFEWIATLMTTLQVLIGLRWMASSPRFAIIFCLFTTIISLVSSLLLHALLRA